MPKGIPKSGVNKGWFKTEETRLKMSLAKLGKPSPKKGKKYKPNLTTRAEKHYNWKGDNVSYQGLHSWIKKKLGTAKFCQYCRGVDRKFVWANKSHKYKRDLNDWLSLCYPCHRKYDLANGWGKAKEIYGKNYDYRQ